MNPWKVFVNVYSAVRLNVRSGFDEALSRASFCLMVASTIYQTVGVIELGCNLVQPANAY